MRTLIIGVIALVALLAPSPAFAHEGPPLPPACRVPNPTIDCILQPSLEARPEVTRTDVAKVYVRLGIEHVLGGWDHLGFLAGLLLLVRDPRRLLGAVTAFTAAHACAVTLAALGYAPLRAPVVEILIAMSLVLVAREALVPHDTLARRRPWLVAGLFGLVHGLGFASALAEIGLPRLHVALALGVFNVGVELAQLGIASALLVGLWALGRTRGRVELLLAYAIGTLGVAWTVQRAIIAFT